MFEFFYFAAAVAACFASCHWHRAAVPVQCHWDYAMAEKAAARHQF